MLDQRLDVTLDKEVTPHINKCSEHIVQVISILHILHWAGLDDLMGYCC